MATHGRPQDAATIARSHMASCGMRCGLAPPLRKRKMCRSHLKFRLRVPAAGAGLENNGLSFPGGYRARLLPGDDSSSRQRTARARWLLTQVNAFRCPRGGEARTRMHPSN
mmetsp:Transcript_132399/g.369108  ORF Transcript_132399/g.369108 Transcript_132399/m.369108 type:complete len:111 (+) Transcript_132399:1104-1436(+)